MCVCEADSLCSRQQRYSVGLHPCESLPGWCPLGTTPNASIRYAMEFTVHSMNQTWNLVPDGSVDHQVVEIPIYVLIVSSSPFLASCPAGRSASAFLAMSNFVSKCSPRCDGFQCKRISEFVK